jgi:hypothetical protein
MDDRSELERCLDALYVAVRDSATVDRQAAFDIAMNELEYRPLHAEARELAETSVADDDETRLASAAAAFLDAYGYEPGFEQAPQPGPPLRGMGSQIRRAGDEVSGSPRLRCGRGAFPTVGPVCSAAARCFTSRTCAGRDGGRGRWSATSWPACCGTWKTSTPPRSPRACGRPTRRWNDARSAIRRTSAPATSCDRRHPVQAGQRGALDAHAGVPPGTGDPAERRP